MNAHETEIARLQTALWMAEKLAGLCRELLCAKRADDQADIARLAEEVETLVTSDAFGKAVRETGEENFYPDILRRKLAELQNTAHIR